MHLCKKVVTFGFGQPRNGTKAAGYHYYKGVHGQRSWASKSSHVHNFPGEASLIRNLANEGYIEMCNEASPPTCGLPHWKIQELAKIHNTKESFSHDGVETLPSFVKIEDAKEDEDYEGLDVANEDLEAEHQDAKDDEDGR